MDTTEQIKAGTIRELMSAPGPCITVALAGIEPGVAGRELKDAIKTLRTELQNRATEGEEILESIRTAAGGALRETTIRGGIVILRAPSIMQVHRVPGVKPIVRVADHFDIRTILSAAAAQKLFYILALSQNRARVLRCTGHSSEEVPFPSRFPTSLADSMQTRQPDHTLDGRSSGGPSIGSGAVVFGTSSDRDQKDGYLHNFFTELDKAVNSILRESTVPLIAAGVQHELALYARVNSYPHLIEPGVQGAPDGMDGAELHSRALELLDRRSREPGHEVPADFDKRAGTGHASTHIQEIVAAAYEGRVSHLFFQIDARYPGTYDRVRHRVKHTDDADGPGVDLIDMAAQQTVLQGGEVKILPGSALPHGVSVCALFRYAAAQAPLEAEPVEKAS